VICVQTGKKSDLVPFLELNHTDDTSIKEGLAYTLEIIVGNVLLYSLPIGFASLNKGVGGKMLN